MRHLPAALLCGALVLAGPTLAVAAPRADDPEKTRSMRGELEDILNLMARHDAAAGRIVIRDEVREELQGVPLDLILNQIAKGNDDGTLSLREDVDVTPYMEMIRGFMASGDGMARLERIRKTLEKAFEGREAPVPIPTEEKFRGTIERFIAGLDSPDGPDLSPEPKKTEPAPAPKKTTPKKATPAPAPKAQPKAQPRAQPRAGSGGNEEGLRRRFGLAPKEGGGAEPRGPSRAERDRLLQLERQAEKLERELREMRREMERLRGGGDDDDPRRSPRNELERWGRLFEGFAPRGPEDFRRMGKLFEELRPKSPEDFDRMRKLFEGVAPRSPEDLERLRKMWESFGPKEPEDFDRMRKMFERFGREGSPREPDRGPGPRLPFGDGFGKGGPDLGELLADLKAFGKLLQLFDLGEVIQLVGKVDWPKLFEAFQGGGFDMNAILGVLAESMDPEDFEMVIGRVFDFLQSEEGQRVQARLEELIERIQTFLESDAGKRIQEGLERLLGGFGGGKGGDEGAGEPRAEKKPGSAREAPAPKRSPAKKAPVDGRRFF